MKGKYKQLFVLIFTIFLLFVAFFFKFHSKSTNNLNQNEMPNQKNWPATNKIVAVSVTSPPFSNSTFIARSWPFQMYLPFAVASWQRFNYSTFIIVIGAKRFWFENGHYLNFIRQTLTDKWPGYVYFHFLNPVTCETSLLEIHKLARAVRIYAAAFEPLKQLKAHHLIVADVDFLPLRNIYHVPSQCSIATSVSHRRDFEIVEHHKPIMISKYN